MTVVTLAAHHFGSPPLSSLALLAAKGFLLRQAGGVAGISARFSAAVTSLAPCCRRLSAASAAASLEAYARA